MEACPGRIAEGWLQILQYMFYCLLLNPMCTYMCIRHDKVFFLICHMEICTTINMKILISSWCVTFLSSVDESTKLRAKMQFLSSKIGNNESAINFPTRFEQRANEARKLWYKNIRRFLCVVLNIMIHHRFYKGRIASFLRTFELNPSLISQRWIDNKFCSMDEERQHIFRNRFIMENARMSISGRSTPNASTGKNKSATAPTLTTKSL